MAKLQNMLLGLVIGGTLFGCATPKHYTTAIDSWRGVPAQFLVGQWGKPTEVKPLANGNQFYLYTAAETRTLRYRYDNARYIHSGVKDSDMVVLNAPIHHASRHANKFWCDTGFEVNKRGVIVNIVRRGTHCVSSIHQEAYLRNEDQ